MTLSQKLKKRRQRKQSLKNRKRKGGKEKLDCEKKNCNVNANKGENNQRHCERDGCGPCEPVLGPDLVYHDGKRMLREEGRCTKPPGGGRRRTTRSKRKKQRRTSQDSLNKKYFEARLSLIKKIDPILNAHMTENGILLVIDKKSVLGGNTDLNITNTIIEKLNKELPSLSIK